MSELLLVIAGNLQLTFIFLGLFSLCVVADILAKTFYNVGKLGQKFDWNKFLLGWIKLVMVGASSGILGIVVAILPTVAIMAGIAITEEVSVIITIGAICLIYFNGIVKYFKSAYETINKIINNEKLFDENNHIS